MQKISIDKIAKMLGVSKTLVSLVINNKAARYGISEATRDRVLQKVKELNYHPNIIARGLRTGKSNVIGLVVADISNPFYSKITRAIEDKVSLKGYHLLVCSSDEDPGKEKNLIDFLVHGQQVCGLIISPTQEKKEDFISLKRRGFPFVLVDRYIQGLKSHCVTVDNYQGSFDAVDHLIKTGFRKIGMLTISPSHISPIRDRIRGYTDALKKNNLPFSDNLVKNIPFHDISSSVKKALQELLVPPHSPQALFILNNNLTVHCLDHLTSMGIRIPQDLALVSFDDVELFKFSHPKISAVAQPVEKIGQAAVDLLFEKLQHGNEKEEKHIVLGTELIVRKSCGNLFKSEA